MPVDTEKMAAERAKRNAGGEIWEVPEGENRVYVCAFPRPEDDLPYAEFRMHYGLGAKASSSHMCLEPSFNKLLLSEGFQEQLTLLKKSISGGCETCERIDKGESVSSDPDQSGKSQSRWLWIVCPMGHRTDARQAWTPPKAEEVKGLSAPYRVWDGLMDQFGQCGDITDMNQAIFPRLIREGTKVSTKWEVQGDVETIRKPVKLSKTLRELIAESTKPGAPFDPLRILAMMVKEGAEIAKIHAAPSTDNEYEQPEGSTEESKPAGGFKPPAKGKSQAQVPATKPAAPAATKPAATKPPAAAGATKAAAPKPEATKPVANGGGKAAANNALKALVAKHGQPPGCYQVDPDPEADICIKCPFQELCFNHCGVPLPSAVAPEEPAEEPAAEEPAGMTVEQCVAGEPYVVNGITATFTGPAKGAFYFKDGDGKAFKVAAGTAVEGPPDEEAPAEEPAAEEPAASDDDDERMKAMEAELAARKAKKAAGAKK